MINISGCFRVGSFVPLAQVPLVRRVLCAFYRVIGQPRLEGILKVHQVQHVMGRVT